MSTRILIVDDNATNLKLASEVLEMEGHEILRAADAEAALEVLKQSRPDLILMDIAMPGMDGLTLTRTLKSDGALSAVPIVALSAFAMKGDRQKAIDAGCDGYITKPINTRTFAAEIAPYLGKVEE
jgi:CheY-like chemotaxis protein